MCTGSSMKKFSVRWVTVLTASTWARQWELGDFQSFLIRPRNMPLSREFSTVATTEPDEYDVMSWNVCLIMVLPRVRAIPLQIRPTWLMSGLCMPTCHPWHIMVFIFGFACYKGILRLKFIQQHYWSSCNIGLCCLMLDWLIKHSQKTSRICCLPNWLSSYSGHEQLCALQYLTWLKLQEPWNLSFYLTRTWFASHIEAIQLLCANYTLNLIYSTYVINLDIVSF